jgi:hypothetical protein
MQFFIYYLPSTYQIDKSFAHPAISLNMFSFYLSIFRKINTSSVLMQTDNNEVSGTIQSSTSLPSIVPKKVNIKTK